MALNLGQKSDRVVRFLLGVNQPRIAGILVRHGFSQKEFDEGWKRLRAVSGERLNALPAPVKDPDALARLDEWENKWFPIIQVTLEHRFPAIHDEVFLNLSQTEGPELAISVGTLVGRLGALKKGDAAHTQARDLLVQRGLTDAIVNDAASYLERLGQVKEPAPVDLEAAQATQQQAEDAMWAWYVEWSTIARSAIKDGRLLQQIGFRLARRGGREEVVEDKPEEPTAPAPVPAGPVG